MAKIIQMFLGLFNHSEGIAIHKRFFEEFDECGDIYPAQLISRSLN